MLTGPAVLSDGVISRISRLVEIEGRMRVFIGSLGDSSGGMTEGEATWWVKFVAREVNSWTSLA